MATIIVATHTPKVGDAFTQTYDYTNDAFASGDILVRLLTDCSYIDLLPVTATISEYGWATFAGDFNLDFSKAATGLTAYAITGHDGAAITKSAVASIVPANTPLLLKGDANAFYNIPIALTDGTAPEGNLLKAGTGASVAPETGKTKYALSVEGGEACFKKITTPRAIPVGKAYLEFNETIAAREFLGLDGDATGIDEANSQKLTANSQYFDLQGRKVAQPTKGLYIVNGKKVIVK